MLIKYTSKIPTEQLTIVDSADLSKPGSFFSVYHGRMVPGFDPTNLPYVGTINRGPEGLYFEPNPDIVGSHQMKGPNDQRRKNLEQEVGGGHARNVTTIDVYDKQQNPLSLVELVE